jgi:predicted amidophosphoribosyltransferase
VNALFIEMLAFSKYRRYRRVGLRLAREAAALVSPLPGAVLVPVPLTKTRHRERGFNQAADFARVLGDRTGLRVEERWLRRVRGGTPLAGRPREERAAAIRGAFEAGAAFPGADAPPLFVVDDVVTTGSTRRACQRALEAAGGRVVACVAMGRAFDSRRDASGGTGAGLPGQF